MVVLYVSSGLQLAESGEEGESSCVVDKMFIKCPYSIEFPLPWKSSF